MAKLNLLRHFKSQWNLENRFTGWVDVPLAKDRDENEGLMVKKLAALDFEVVYSSPLVRNLATVLEVFEYMNQKYPVFMHQEGKMKKWAHFEEIIKNYVPVYLSESLNERYYGNLQGLGKEATMKKYGQEQVRLWRRSYNTAPPGGESLADVMKRTLPFYKKNIENDLRNEKNVLVVASHNSLRALVKYIEKISDDDIINLEIPYGGLLEYEFSKDVYRKLD